MKIDGKEILERLAKAKKDDRKKVSLYLSEGLYEEFKKQCERGGVPASQAMEELMRVFCESLRR